jgi:signal transduction histidine kinase
VIEGVCYALLVAAWIVDLVTPQLFVAAILLNGPIALSSLALRPSLTIRLMILAEIANVVAGYTNGLQAGHHWDTIAIGDRMLSGASFLLVGFLTMRTQENARQAGEAAARDRQIARERSLRHAMEHVRASLNSELVLRAAVVEAVELTGADRVRIVRRDSSFDVPDIYEARPGERDVSVTRGSLQPEFTTLLERAREARRVVAIDPNDPIGRLLGEAALCAVLPVEGVEIALILTWRDRVPTSDDRGAVQDFADNLAVALQQAQLFLRLAAQTDEIVRQKDALQARSDVIRDIVYALAHDLRTPLSAADLTMSQALAGAYGDLPERYREVLQTSIASNADLRRLVETLLLVARYESGEDSRALERREIAPLVARVVEEMRPIADIKGVSLALLPSAAVAREVDGDELRRAITNLVANAIEATPAGGTVTAAVAQRAGVIAIEVNDDGFGVPAERRAALFQRFGGRRGGAGTGLGLYIVRRIAEKYGGTASYEPREPRGSRFRIELPIDGDGKG